MIIPNFNTKSELFAFLKANKSALIAQKKYSVKQGDCVQYFVYNEEGTEQITKSIANPTEFKGDQLKVSLVINTTNIMDSHSDVHLPGIWNKSLKETKGLYLLEEHKMSFRNIISDDVKAFTKNFFWNELGYNAIGVTQALVFNTTIDKNRNEYMFEQYLKGRVKNHSVGMSYTKLELALNSDSKYDEEERKVWDKYIDQIVNKDKAIDQGYFWAVSEAKVIEGSAVPVGSNTITPTLSVEEKQEPSLDTQIQEPVKSTHKVNYNYLTNNFKL